MPHRLFLDATAAELARRFAAAPDAAVAAGPGTELAPGQPVPAAVADGASGRALVAMRWGLIPMGRINARRRPVLETIVNARGETLFAKSAFAGLGRCIVPVGGWYEWTGAGRKRMRWTIRVPSAPALAIAAVWDCWRAPGGGEVASLATSPPRGTPRWQWCTSGCRRSCRPGPGRSGSARPRATWARCCGRSPTACSSSRRPARAGLLNGFSNIYNRLSGVNFTPP